MKKIELNGKKYNCPESWDEITLAQQMKVSADTDAIQIEELKRFAILSGYCNIPIEVLKTAKITELTQLFLNMEFINKPLPDMPITEFDFNGKHYYCGQQLVENEFQDFISIENTIAEYSGNTYMALPTILAVMCKQKKSDGMLESLGDYQVVQRAKEFEKLPITIAHQLSLFFSLSDRIYSNLFPLYLKPVNQKAILQTQIDSVEAMLKELAGRGLLMKCASGILRISLKSIRRQLDKHYTSTQ